MMTGDIHMIAEDLPPVILVHPAVEDHIIAVQVTILLRLGGIVTQGMDLHFKCTKNYRWQKWVVQVHWSKQIWVKLGDFYTG